MTKLYNIKHIKQKHVVYSTSVIHTLIPFLVFNDCLMKETNVLISSGVDRFTKSLSTYSETLRKERLCQFSNCEHPSGAYTEYMVYISLSWWSIKWHVEFLDYGLLLTMKLLNQGFLVVKLKSSLWKFYGRHLHMFNFVVTILYSFTSYHRIFI